ncbi:hypothetical protein G6F31_016258 [Rhizopus arrhizus]|nr:hypothetical protein G6F31_016258 [Rhizopus arrhizus]
MLYFQHETVLAIEHHLVAGLQPAVAHGHAVDPGTVGTAQVAKQYALAVHFYAGVLLGERRVIDGDVGLAAAANQAGPRQIEAAPMMEATDTAQQALLFVADLFVFRRRRLQQAFDLTLQHHLHAIHIHCVACTQQGHPAHRPAVHVDAADTVADLQPEAAVVHAELRQQQGAVAGVAEPHAAVGLAHDALHPGPQGLVGLLLLTEALDAHNARPH